MPAFHYEHYEHLIMSLEIWKKTSPKLPGSSEPIVNFQSWKQINNQM